MIQFRQYSTYSILRAIGHPSDIVEKLSKEGYIASAITEKNNVFSAVKFFKACKEKNIKPILGCEFSVRENEREFKLLCHAKNLNGWKGILKAIHLISLPDNNNTLTLEKYKELFNNNVLVYVGSITSELGQLIFNDYNSCFSLDYEETKLKVKNEWKEIVINLFSKYKELFGENLIAEICIDDLPGTQILAKILKSLKNELKIKFVYNTNPNYINYSDAEIHRILLCSALKTTLYEFDKKAEKENAQDLLQFFKSSSYYIKSKEELSKIYSEEEINENNEILSLIEDYDILSKPVPPEFVLPENFKSPSEYLRSLCLDGWNKLIKGKIPKDQEKIYGERIKYELGVLKDAELENYFLIVYDIISWARKTMMAEARGSVGGSMVAYLLGIHGIDSIKYKLMFERFYSAAKGKIALPDIDIDFPVQLRDKVVQKTVEKYGRQRVANITTFGTLKGKNALKEVLRIKNRCSSHEMNIITSFIPDESKIADKLEEMEQEEGESSIIKWVLENSTSLNEWCKLTEEGLDGPFAIDFKQAIALEGCIKSHGKHAAGIIIGKNNLDETGPFLYDGDTYKVGYDMGDSEASGWLKMDFLGVKAIDDIMETIKIVRGE